MRIVNVVFWFAVWIAVMIHFNAFDQPARAMGEAVIPALLCFAIDAALRRRQGKIRVDN